MRKASPSSVPTMRQNVPAQSIDNSLWPDLVASSQSICDSGAGHSSSFKVRTSLSFKEASQSYFPPPPATGNVGNAARCTPSITFLDRRRHSLLVTFCKLTSALSSQGVNTAPPRHLPLVTTSELILLFSLPTCFSFSVPCLRASHLDIVPRDFCSFAPRYSLQSHQFYLPSSSRIHLFLSSPPVPVHSTPPSSGLYNLSPGLF